MHIIYYYECNIYVDDLELNGTGLIEHGISNRNVVDICIGLGVNEHETC